jgi:3' exoribonuclease, RNase T-like
MRVFVDTEFIEDGKTIDLISIGAVREDGKGFYAENSECDCSRASAWVEENVFPKLSSGQSLMSRTQIAHDFVAFCGDSPEFWAYYADYDWVVLCQLFGTMRDLPEGWPKFCMDLKQLVMSKGNPRLPTQISEHNALADAKWVKEMWERLSE